MIKEAINRIVELAERPKQYQLNGRTYLDGDLTLLCPPQPPAFRLMTLTGLVDLLRSQPATWQPSEWMVDVCSHQKLAVRKMADDTFGRREVFATCELEDGDGFRFGQWMDRESFVIGLMNHFVEADELLDLLRLVSTLASEGVTTAEDDGISQKTAVRQGVVLKELTKIRPRWTLRPFRTFREIDQPASQFVLRLRAEPGQVPQCALFEADGGKWKLDAVLAIKDWLSVQPLFPLGLPVVA